MCGAHVVSGGQRDTVARHRVVSAVVHDAHSRLTRGVVELVDGVAHKVGLCGDVHVVCPLLDACLQTQPTITIIFW